MSIRDDRQPTQVRFTYGGREIVVAVTFRANDRLSISVHPDQRVTALVPAGRPIEQIAARIQARAGWILQRQREFERYQPLPVGRRYVSGETHIYLGKQYRLRVRLATVERVWMQAGYICVDSRAPGDAEHVRQQLEAWYRTRAAEVLGRRYGICCELVRSMQVPSPKPLLRAMHRRWGSCGKAGRILLNPDLVKVPVQCVDYVIVHELCHLKVLHHNKQFYALMARYMPDWEKRKQRLDRIVLPLA